MPSTLNREEILELLLGDPPMVEDAPDTGLQLQPNGMDLTIREAAVYKTAGTLMKGSQAARLPETARTEPDSNGALTLTAGAYLITFNERLNMPSDVIGLVRPRSSLLRAGAALHTGVWDAGYSGRSQALLSVINPEGIVIEQGARIGQMIFMRMSKAPGEIYQGRYQGEGEGERRHRD